ncbi:hypothetical protein RD792_012134, partial [Penstemon davidsonii]
GLFLALPLYWSSPFAYGDTDPQEVAALLAVRNKLNDPYKNLKWNKKSDPCTNWTGVICYLNNTDGYMHVEELRLLRLNLSGTLAPELGQLTYMKRLDFLWNYISGSIPKEISHITALELLLLSGNQISGSLPDELGYLPNLTKFQLDLNFISGPIPTSFANLVKVQHFHMNNNRFSGQIPPELSQLNALKHVLLDNNNLSGYLPPELAQMRGLTILQLDNNNFAGSVIPNSYGNMAKLLKLSLRNCSLQGTIPDLSGIRGLLYLDLSMNQFTGRISTNRLSENTTTMYLDNNLLSGSVPSNIWQNINFTSDTNVDINFENNLLSDILGILEVPQNVTLKLQGNPVCANASQRNISLLCGPDNGNDGSEETLDNLNKPVSTCPPQACPIKNHFRYVPTLPSNSCFCAAPFGVGLRLRSPSISSFLPYRDQFDMFITKYVNATPNTPLDTYQLYVDSIEWEKGPRLRMFLLFFPRYSNDSSIFKPNEVQEIARAFATFALPGSDIFGPYDLLNFTAEGPYSDVILPSLSSAGLSKGALAGIVLGSIFCASVILLGILLLIRKKHKSSQVEGVKNQSLTKFPMKMDGVKAFSFEDLQTATSNFSSTTQIGQGGYGKVYKGTLADGVVVAIKRAQQGSLQGDKEFYTEIEMLSRLHHRNLVALVGYCDEKDEQMLVYEFMPNGSLHDLLTARYRAPLGFGTRLHIALNASRGILYLHTEADPPIIHRDIKANNILLDSKMTAKVSDFGISRLAPISDPKGLTTAHISTIVKGTPGYVDPEYFLTNKLTEKSDVYSLGIVFLELLTGMQPISHGRNIVREVNTAHQSGMMFSIIDRSMGQYPSEGVKKFMALAVRCSSDETKDRPLMLEVVRELENISSMLPESDNTASEFLNVNLSSGGTSVASAPSTSVYDRRSTYLTEDHSGGDLVSGVVHSIMPR